MEIINEQNKVVEKALENNKEILRLMMKHREIYEK
jgi:hypothetical protein